MNHRQLLPIGLLVLVLVLGFSSSRLLQYQFGLKAKKLPENPVLSHGNTDPNRPANHIAGNCLLKNQQNETLLFYYKNLDEKDKPISRIGFAKSNDNLNFTTVKEDVLGPGKAGEWDSGGVSVFPNCIIQKADGTYYMYYTGYSQGAPDFYSGGKGGIGLAFSKDLMEWRKFEKNPILVRDEKISWESEGVFEPSVLFSGDEFGSPEAYQMWYGGNGKEGRMSIGYAQSYDGTVWTKFASNPVLSFSNKVGEFDAHTIEVHNVLKRDNRYTMAYEATDAKFPSHFRIGLAHSKDGKSWTKSTANPILEGGSVGSWDSMGAYHPSILVEDNQILMYYVGLNNKYEHQIGVAEINPFYFHNDGQ